MLRALLDPGDEVILLSPYFPDYPVHALNHGGKPRIVDSGPGFLPDPGSVERAIGWISDRRRRRCRPGDE